MIGWYVTAVNDEGLILAVQDEPSALPQTLWLTRSEWASFKRKIDAKFFNIKRVRCTK